MSQTTIELTIMAAEGLKNVSLLRGKMDPYAVAFVDPCAKRSTRVLHKGGVDPVWNDSMEIPVDDHVLYDPNASLTIQIFNQSSISTSLIGATKMMLQDLLRHKAVKGNDEADIVTLQLWRPSGRAHGIVRVFLNLKGERLPSIDGLFGAEGAFASNNYLALAASSEAPATGIPVMSMQPYAAVGPSSSVVPYVPGKSQKYAHTYNSSYVQPSYLPYPTPPSSRARRNNNFLFGLVSGAVAAVLLGAMF